MTFFLPSRHFVSFSQKIIYRGGGISVVWPQFLMVAAIGLAFFSYSKARPHVEPLAVELGAEIQLWELRPFRCKLFRACSECGVLLRDL
jgi:hypothetical protein